MERIQNHTIVSAIGLEIMSDDWKTRVYDSYVSGGRLVTEPDPAKLFGQRAPYIKQVIRKHIPQKKDARVLELACGPAPFIYFLKADGYTNLSGIDVSPEQVSLAHALGLNQVRLGDMNLFLEQADRESFDIVIMFDILEHFTREKQLNILDKVVSVLKPDGKCILHLPNAEGYCGTRVLYSDITHETSFTRRSITQILGLVGLSDVQCTEDKPIPHGTISLIRRIIWEVMTLGWRITLSAETGGLPTSFILSQNMLVVARKK